MKRKVTVLTLCALLLGLCASAEAQQPKKIPRIGFLLAPSRSAVAESLEAFRQGLRDLGYVEGQNITIEYRYARESSTVCLNSRLNWFVSRWT